MEKSIEQKPKIKTTHILADGTVRDSMKGYKVPYNETTAVAYNLLATWIRRAADSEA